MLPRIAPSPLRGRVLGELANRTFASIARLLFDSLSPAVRFVPHRHPTQNCSREWLAEIAPVGCGELANRTIGRPHDCHRTIVIGSIDPNGAVRSSPAPYQNCLRRRLADIAPVGCWVSLRTAPSPEPHDSHRTIGRTA